MLPVTTPPPYGIPQIPQKVVTEVTTLNPDGFPKSAREARRKFFQGINLEILKIFGVLGTSHGNSPKIPENQDKPW